MGRDHKDVSMLQGLKDQKDFSKEYRLHRNDGVMMFARDSRFFRRNWSRRKAIQKDESQRQKTSSRFGSIAPRLRMMFNRFRISCTHRDSTTWASLQL